MSSTRCVCVQVGVDEFGRSKTPTFFFRLREGEKERRGRPSRSLSFFALVPFFLSSRPTPTALLPPPPPQPPTAMMHMTFYWGMDMALWAWEVSGPAR